MLRAPVRSEPSQHRALFEGADAVLSMLPAGKHVKAVMLGDDGIFCAASRGHVGLGREHHRRGDGSRTS